MVTEILRPVLFTSSADGGCSFIPASTEDQAYTLVNEITADDDATYINITGSLFFIVLYFTSKKLKTDYDKISSINIVAKIKADPSITLLTTGLYLYDDSSVGGSNDIQNTITHNTSDWEFVNALFNNKEDIKQVIESALTYNAENPLAIHFGVARGANNTQGKNYSLSITQVYVEVAYEDDSSDTPTSETIYLKDNGSWSSIPCAIYQKQNDIWVLADSSVLEEGFRYVLNDITIS